MNNRLKTGLLGLSVMLMLMVSAAAQLKKPSLVPPKYSAVALPAYWSDRYGSGAAISRTCAAGHFQSASGTVHAALFDLNGNAYQDLGVLPGDSGSVAFAVNDRGQAAGYGSTASGLSQRAVVFSDGLITQIPKLPFFGDLNTYSIALGINNRGQVVGYETPWNGSGSHGFLYADGFLTDLGDGWASAINRRGVIVGTFMFNGNRHAAKIIGSGLHDLGVLPGDDTSTARAINDSNHIVGSSFNTRTQTGRAFIYYHRIDALPSLPSDTGTYALGINKRGTIVGYGHDSSGVWHAVIWIAGQVYDLNALVPAGTPHINAAYGINDAGQIITDNFLLAPVEQSGG